MSKHVNKISLMTVQYNLVQPVKFRDGVDMLTCRLSISFTKSKH